MPICGRRKVIAEMVGLRMNTRAVYDTCDIVGYSIQNKYLGIIKSA